MNFFMFYPYKNGCINLLKWAKSTLCDQWNKYIMHAVWGETIKNLMKQRNINEKYYWKIVLEIYFSLTQRKIYYF